MTKSFTPKKEEINREWHLIDADNKVLGRVATDVAALLIGKHKPQYSPHMNLGDKVVVINASKVGSVEYIFRFTGFFSPDSGL